MKVPEYSNPRVRLIVLFSLPFAFSLLFFSVSISSEHNESKILSLDALRATVGTLQGIASDAEIGEHGFLLTGDERYLSSLEAANSQLALVRRSIKSGLGDAELQPRIDSLLVKVEERVRDANEVVALQRSKGLTATLEYARTGPSEVLMDNIRSQQLALKIGISKLSDIHRDYEQKLSRWSFLFFLVGSIVTLLVMVGLYKSFVSYIESRNAYMKARDAAHIELRALNADL